MAIAGLLEAILTFATATVYPVRSKYILQNLKHECQMQLHETILLLVFVFCTRIVISHALIWTLNKNASNDFQSTMVQRSGHIYYDSGGCNKSSTFSWLARYWSSFGGMVKQEWSPKSCHSRSPSSLRLSDVKVLFSFPGFLSSPCSVKASPGLGVRGVSRCLSWWSSRFRREATWFPLEI